MKAFIKILSFVFFFFIIKTTFALLPAQKTSPFSLSASFVTPDAIEIHFDIMEGNYLYRDHIAISSDVGDTLRLGDLQMPMAQTVKFENGQQYAVYNKGVSIRVPVAYPDDGRLSLSVRYQGCSNLGYCFAPVEKRIRLSVQNQEIFVDDVQTPFSRDLVTDQEGAASFLAGHTLIWVVPVFIALGLLLAFTPCVLPMVPILSSIIVGHSKMIKLRKAFGLSLAYVLTMSATYAIIGLIVAAAGNYFQALTQETWIIVLFSGLFVLLALSMFGFYEFRIPMRIEEKIGRFSRKQGGGSYFSVVVMGFLATIILSPCVTAPLVGVLSYIALTGDKLLGSAALFSLGFGMGIPLIIVGTSAGFLLPRAGVWLDAVRVVFGVMLVGLAIFLLGRVLPGSIILLLWGVWLIIISVTLGSFRLSITRIAKASRVFGLIIFMYAMILLIGGALGYESPLYPFSHQEQRVQLPFQTVADMAELQSVLASAKKAVQPVVIYFHARWCVACSDIEANVFPDARVMRALAPYTLIKVDITTPDEKKRKIENVFDVIAPPTFIFINDNGQVMLGKTIVGEVRAAKFLQRLLN